jgi:uncharacterized protein HemY
MLTLIAQFGPNSIQPQNSRADLIVTDNYSALNSLTNFISQLFGVMTVLAGLFFIVYFVMGAFKWTAAGGDSGKVQKARDQMVQGVLGLILIVASYSIIGLIGTILGLEILDPMKAIGDIINI